MSKYLSVTDYPSWHIKLTITETFGVLYYCASFGCYESDRSIAIILMSHIHNEQVLLKQVVARLLFSNKRS